MRARDDRKLTGGWCLALTSAIAPAVPKFINRIAAVLVGQRPVFAFTYQFLFVVVSLVQASRSLGGAPRLRNHGLRAKSQSACGPSSGNGNVVPK